MRIKLLFAALLSCGVLSGCASTNEMALDQQDSGVDVRTQSMLLLTLSISQQGSILRVPCVNWLYIERPNARNRNDRQMFAPDQEGMVEVNGRTTYEMRMAIDPGTYRVVAAMGQIGVFPMIGTFRVPLVEDITVPAHAVVYLGHMEVVLRPKMPGEFAAGPVLPLLDQAATGISGGTFDVTVTNQVATDIPMLRGDFPALQASPITVLVLPQWDRAEATAWATKNYVF